jgi:hypothetical protein
MTFSFFGVAKTSEIASAVLSGKSSPQNVCLPFFVLSVNDKARQNGAYILGG